MKEIAHERLDDLDIAIKAAERTKQTKKSVEESVRQTLLRQLPTDLRPKWQNASAQEIMGIIEARHEAGFETITGYHTSNIDLNVGEYIGPGSDGTVHYTTSLDNLYGKKAKYLYVVEGSSSDLVNDPGLDWRQSRAGMKILDKIELTPENLEKLEADFAKVEYS